MVTEGADISESTERVCNYEARAVGEVLVLGGVLEGIIGDKFVLWLVRRENYYVDRELTVTSLVPISLPTLSRSPSRETPSRKAMG